MASQTDDWTAFELQTRVALGHRPLIAVETTELKSFCTCSEERIERALLLTGEAATLEALADDDFMSITCDFCRKPYRLAATRVRALFKRDPSSRLQ
jgi:molecular chaperone Hsp33